jgi:hypothetical protein
MHGAATRVVAVDQCVCQSFPEGWLRVSGNRHAQQPEIDLFSLNLLTQIFAWYRQTGVCVIYIGARGYTVRGELPVTSAT